MATKLKPPKKITTEQAERISVRIIKENEDGSADAQVTFNKEGLETLIQWGLVSMLTKGLNEYACDIEPAKRPSNRNSKDSAGRKSTKKKESKK